jgi:hypothetical protein
MGSASVGWASFICSRFHKRMQTPFSKIKNLVIDKHFQPYLSQEHHKWSKWGQTPFKLFLVNSFIDDHFQLFMLQNARPNWFLAIVCGAKNKLSPQS